MTLLLLNTCGAEGLVALADGEQVPAEEVLPGRGAGEQVLPALRRVLARAGVVQAQAVVAVRGPGSFTGVRVGLALAKGLCEGWVVPLLTLSRLELLRVGEPAAVALLDAGRGEFYASAEAGLPERVVGLEEARGLTRERAVVTCEPRVRDLLGDEVRLVPEPGAAAMLALALPRVQAGLFDGVAEVDAQYLRRTDAELLQGQQAAAGT